ncbi:MAG: TolC family protein [Nitrospinae bacterium]|nr:TolC family protein [Nitrospinota bacterium]
MARHPVIAFLAAISLVFSLTACVSGVAKEKIPPRFTGGEAFEQGLVLYVRGELDDAADRINEAIKKNPHDLRARDLAEMIAMERDGHVKNPEERRDIEEKHREMVITEPLGGEEVAMLVAGRHPRIRQAVYTVAAARGRLREANVSVGPEFTLYSRLSPSGFMVSLAQNLFGGLWNRDAALSSAEWEVIQAMAEYARVKNDALYKGIEVYLDLLEAEDTVTILADEVTERERQLAVIRRQVAHGFLPSVETPRIQAHHETAKSVLATMTEERNLARIRLNGFMGRPHEAPLPVRRQRILISQPVNFYQTLSGSVSSRPEIARADAEVGHYRGVKKETETAAPDIDLKAAYGSSSQAAEGDFLTGTSLGIRISAPILVLPLQKARSDRMEAFVRRLEHEARWTEAVMIEEAGRAYQLFSAQQQVLAAQLAQLKTGYLTVWRDEAALRWAGGDSLPVLLNNRSEHLLLRRRALNEYYGLQKAATALQRALGDLPEKVRFEDSAAPTASDQLFDTLTYGPARHGRGLWVWKAPFLDDEKERSFFLDFLEARRIDTLFYSAGFKLLSEKAEALAAFLTAAHARGIKVHALSGAPSWAAEPARAAEYVAAVVAFNKNATRQQARFDAVHLDIEPHADSRWKKDRVGMGYALLDALETAKTEADTAHIPLAIDLPDWYDTIMLKDGNLAEAAMAKADMVALMAYRKNAKSVQNATVGEEYIAANSNQRLWIGLSTDPAHLGGSRRLMSPNFEILLDDTEERLRGKSNTSVAIHDYARYRRLIIEQ